MKEKPNPPPYEEPAPHAAGTRTAEETPMFASTSAPLPSSEETSGSPIAISFLSRVRPGFWDD